MSSTEKVLLTEGSLEDIADAIREKNGTETEYKPREMAPAIRALNTGTDWGEIGGTLSDQTDLQDALDGKVDTVTGKQLSTEDYTTAEKTKLGALPDAATLNADLASKADDSVVVKSVNTKTPTNGAVEVTAEDIPADGIGDKNVSGNPIVIEDGMASVAKELSVTLEPIQDLHGYESPWIGTDTDKQPYLFRAVSESSVQDKGTHEMDKLVGGTVAFNQLIKNGDFSVKSDWVLYNADYSVTNGEATITVNSSPASIFQGINVPNSTKLLSMAFVKNGVSTTDVRLMIEGSEVGSVTDTSSYTNLNKVWNKQGNGRLQVTVRGESGNVGYAKNITTFNLTAMFGSTIADYIYSLEQATAGAGVAWFRKLFPAPYYAYDSGTLISVKTSAHVMRDANDNIIGNYPLDSDLELRGIPKLDSNNKLYYDGDIYEASGNVKRRYGAVDLGTLGWTYDTDGDYPVFYTRAIINLVKKPVSWSTGYAVCSDYIVTFAISRTDFRKNDYNGRIIITAVGESGVVCIQDSRYTDATAFATAMSGVYLVYELATPTTETADPFTSAQVIDPDGTEEYVDSRTVPIPVGHESAYANICPISGRTGTEVQRTGKNLVESINHWQISSRGLISQDASYDSAIVRVESGQTYVNSQNGIATAAVIGYFANYPSVGNTTYDGSRYISEDGIFTSPITGYAVVRNVTGAMNLQVEPGSVPTSYEPYHAPDTVSVTFGQTVYGCTHDFVSGKCRVTHGIVDLGTLDWWKHGDGDFMQTNSLQSVIGGLPHDTQHLVSGAICSHLPIVTAYSIYQGGSGIGVNEAGSVRAKATGMPLVGTDFATFVSGWMFVYMLKTPIELTLTPAQLSLLQGTNILTADGTINLTYLGTMASNVQDEIDEFENGLNNVIGSIAFIENQTAKTSHAVGEYVILNGIFCKVISAISSGETLSFGTNIQATTIGAELRAIWEELNA